MHDPGPLPAILDRTRLVYSYTNLNCYENVCPYQFYERYIKKTVPFVETGDMKWGTAVHEAMELRISANKPLPIEAKKWKDLKQTPEIVNMQQWEPFAEPFDKIRESP